MGKESFKQEALESWARYQETGLHVTGEEAREWLSRWGADDESEIPRATGDCHRGRHSDIGRPLEDLPELRELIIPFGSTGYVALYRHDPGADTVYVLAFRHQKEAGYQ